MALFPSEMPAPEPGLDDAEFWEGCRSRRLLFQACGRCGSLRHPPTPICAKCHATETRLIEAPRTARIFSFTEIHHASHPAVQGRMPYIVAVVEFPELPGPRLVTNVTDTSAESLRIGDEVHLWWDDIGDGMFLPRFSTRRDRESQ